MTKVDEFRRRAEGYRRLKRHVTDPAAVQAINELAEEYEITAAQLEKRHRTRQRAHAIWTEWGRPEGQDVEIWLAAERELQA